MCVPREQEEWPGGGPKSPAELAKSMDVFDWTTGLSIRQVGRPVRYPPSHAPSPAPSSSPNPNPDLHAVSAALTARALAAGSSGRVSAR